MSNDHEVGELLQRAAGDHPGEPPVGGLVRRGRRRRLRRRVGAVATAAVVVIAGAVAMAELDQFHVEFAPADEGGAGDVSGEDVFARPAPGEARAEWLTDGTPVFIVAHADDTVSVVEAVSTHRVGGPLKLVEWCGSSRTFDDLRHESAWNAHGEYRGGPAPTALATYAAEVTDEHVRVRARQAPKSRDAQSSAEDAGPPCPDESGASGPLDPDRQRDYHDPSEAPWPALTPAQLTDHDTPAVVDGTAVYSADGTARLCSEPAVGPPPRCPSDSPELADTRPAPPASAYTGTFLAVAEDDGRYSLIAFGRPDSEFFGSPASETPSDRPPKPAVVEGGPRTRVEDGLLLVPALDIAYGRPPDTVPAGTYQLRLENRGRHSHTLVNDELGVDLAAESGEQATARVHLPPGEHVFYCRIRGHREAGMELHLTVKMSRPSSVSPKRGERLPAPGV